MAIKSRDTSKTIQESIATTHVAALDVDMDAMAAISNVFRVSVLFHNQAEKRFLLQHKLSFSGFTVLWVLWVFGKMESYQLAEECGITKGTLTGIVSTLEKHGFAERRAHPSDGRRRLVRLTRKGDGLMKKLFPTINALEQEFVAGLKPAELVELSRMLRIILHSQDPVP
ncbi:MAG: MarR family transcriptional regulator [Gammaproteobacteria bacterium]|nr:MarR family transcriptional regulator [Gammaproteobacteria bacterium]